MKVFIIGGTGLISTAISSQLAARKDEVVLFNRGLSRNRAQIPLRQIQGDRNDEAALGAALAKELPDAVIDMVAYAPSQAQSLLRACEGRTPQVLVCSSVCVYGGPLTHLPADENEPHRPVGDYGRNKSSIEAIILSRSGPSNQHGTIMRPSFTTGEGATASGLVFDDSTVNRLRQGLPVVVMDDGLAAWAIAHVSDVASGFVSALGNPASRGQAYNLTSDEHTHWNGIFEALADAAGAPPPVLTHIPSSWLYAQAPRRSVGIQYIFRHPSLFDNTKASRDLNFKTTISLRETFKRQIAWMEQEGLLKATSDEKVQDELSSAWLEKRDVVAGRFEDCNPWGNSTTG